MFVRSILSGLILVTLGLAAPAQTIHNPSFELQSDGIMPNGCPTDISPLWGLPDAWNWRRQGATNGHGAMLPQGHPTDGAWSLEMFGMGGGDYVPGDFIEWYQTVDLTQVVEILFDVTLEYHSGAVSYVSVDGQELWSSNDEGTHLDKVVDVSQLAGDHELAVGVRMTEYAFPGHAGGMTYWDNLRPITAVATESTSLSQVKSLFR